jgi:hypothetical protein
VCVCVVYHPLSLLGNGSVETILRQRINTQQQKNCWTRCFQCGPCRMKESRRLVLPRTSCALLLLDDAVRTVTRYSVGDRMINKCGVVGWVRIGRRNRNTRKKSAPVPLCPQIPSDLAWESTKFCTLNRIIPQTEGL